MHSVHISSGGRYPVLRAIAILYVIAAGVALIIGIGATFWMLIRGAGDAGDHVIEALATLAVTFLAVLSMLALAEVLKLFIDVEHHLRVGVGGSAASDLTTGTTNGPSALRSSLMPIDDEPAEAALIRGH